MNDDTPDGGWEEYKRSMEVKGFDPVASASVEAFDKAMENLHPDLKNEKCEDELCERKQYARAAFNFKGFCCARCQVRTGHSVSCDERNGA